VRLPHRSECFSVHRSLESPSRAPVPGPLGPFRPRGRLGVDCPGLSDTGASGLPRPPDRSVVPRTVFAVTALLDLTPAVA
jgi:hypothetical protein